MNKINKYTKWTIEKIKKESNKYIYREDFFKKSRRAYDAAYKRGILKDIIKDLKNKNKRYWTIEKLKREALKYKYRSDFKNGNSGAYSAAIDLKCMDLICKHMKFKSSYYLRNIYVYEFENKQAYIGLTCKINNRMVFHKNVSSSSVYNLINSKIPFKFKILYKNLPIEKATKKEKELIKLYKNNNWNVLNRTNGGELGARRIYWTIDRIKSEAIKYKNKKEFRINSPKAWDAAKAHRVVNIVCSHMPNRTIKYTIDILKKIALKYKTRYQFQKNNASAYESARKQKLLDIVCNHMENRSFANSFS